MSIKAKLSVLVQLANIDGEFAGEEKDLIYMIGKANGISEDEINDMVENPEPLPPLSTMSEDDKFEYLFHLVQLMKIDSQVYLSEIKFCEELAEKLGFKRNVTHLNGTVLTVVHDDITTPGQEFTWANWGMPIIREGCKGGDVEDCAADQTPFNFGNLIVRVHVNLPPRLKAHQTAAFSRLLRAEEEGG